MTATLQDPWQEVQKILHFLGKEVVEGTVARMLHHTSLQEMRKNPAADHETMPTTLMDHSLSPFLWKSGVGQRWRLWDRCPWAVLQSLFTAASILGVSGFAPLIFLPPGITGDWKNRFTMAQNRHFDQPYQEHMAGSNLNFQMEV